jgi:DNA mismatch repair protein MutL
MMGKIIALDEGTINRIAAGEVIERPASIVKELVENSIDAGASKIDVKIKRGGIPFIRVWDNGSGIEKEDVRAAFERHSTSKIKHSTELSSVLSLGFRGEALASIAAVSKVEMVTRTESTSYGTKINLAGGNIIDISQVGASVGTLITIKDVFYNTPARFKFLKRDSTESGYVADILNRIALSSPSISIGLENNGTKVINTPGNNDLLSTIVSIYGTEVGKSVLKIEYEDELVSITGYAGKPEISRSNRNHQSIFVNGRYTKSKILTAAIDEAYRTYLMKNRFAFLVLKIEINPSTIDINVHPTKMEVRFSDESNIFRAVYHSINNTLIRESKIREINSGISMNKEENDNFKKNINTLGNNDEPKLPLEEVNNFLIGEVNKSYNNLEIREDVLDTEAKTDISQSIGGAKLIGQLFSTYIVLQKDSNIFVIDQHAAHERIVFEELKKKYFNNEPLSQGLISPYVINLTYQELKAFGEHKDFFNKLGYIYEEFGNNSIMIRALPYGEAFEDEKENLLQLLDILIDSVKEDYNAIIDKVLYKIACKTAIKANMNLKGEETKELLKKLLTLDNPYTCPHGRPTAVKISKDEIEKIFKRRL